MKRLFHKPALLKARTQSTFDGDFAHGRPGWWHKQMLVDRSLRSMAAFTAVSAVIMLIILISYLPAFANRVNHNSTSVGGKAGTSCSTSESRNVVRFSFPHQRDRGLTRSAGCTLVHQYCRDNDFRMFKYVPATCHISQGGRDPMGFF